jgi:hypothetical protein
MPIGKVTMGVFDTHSEATSGSGGLQVNTTARHGISIHSLATQIKAARQRSHLSETNRNNTNSSTALVLAGASDLPRYFIRHRIQQAFISTR